MKVAIPVWQGSVSPVFDVARTLLLVDIREGAVHLRRLEPMEETGVLARSSFLRALSADALLCGAISRPLEQMLLSAGIEVIPNICGDVDEVLSAYLNGRLQNQTFLMPGCGGGRRRWWGGRGSRHGFGPRRGFS
jgi:predicted Fe-Mo cluster-binding NifX family protein